MRAVSGILVLLLAMTAFVLIHDHGSDADTSRATVVVPATDGGSAKGTLPTALPGDVAQLFRAKPVRPAPPPPPDEDGSAAQATSRTLRVKVVDDRRQPVADAEIDVWEQEPEKEPGAIARLLTRFQQSSDPEPADPTNGPPAFHVLSNALGEASFTVGGGDITVVATKGDHLSSGRWMPGKTWAFGRAVDWKASAGGHPDQATLELHGQAEIRGHLLGVDGQPAAGATVSFELGHLRQSLTIPRTPVPMETDPSGSFSVFVDAPITVTVTATHREKSAHPGMCILKEGETANLSLRIVGAYSISGRVVTREDDVVVGARVIASSGLLGPWVDAVSTGAGGTFQVDLASPGSYQVIASASGLVTEAPNRLILSDARRRAETEITMIESSTIRGRVIWDDGEPLPNAAVSGSPKVNDASDELRSFAAELQAMTTTGRDGHFELQAIHPSFTYSVSTGGTLDTRTRVAQRDIAPGAKDVELVIAREEAAGYTIRGRVVSEATGNPITEYGLLSGMWIRGVYNGTSRNVSDPDGRFELQGLWPYQNAIEIRAEGYPPKTVGPLRLTREPLDLEIALASPGALAVHVTDAEGRPLPGAAIELRASVSEESSHQFMPVWSGVVGETGGLRWPEVPPGRYAFQAAQGDAISDVTVVRVTGAEQADATVVIRESLELATLIVTVVDGEGNALPDIDLVARTMSPIGGEAFAGEHATKAGHDGRAIIPGLVAGHYWVWPQAPNAFVGPRFVAVPSATETVVEFRLGSD